jgi:catechol 2,3-dioxygenase-like lactoylglutathione lyase family enzyme
MHAVRQQVARRGANLGGMIDHVTLQVSDVAASRVFYEAVLAPLAIGPGHTDGAAVGFFGTEPGSFWICPAQRAEDRELHIAFRAPTRDGVRAFHAAAVEAGAEILHAPRTFPEYHENYYGSFVRDPDGHNIEAVCHQPEG